MRATSTTDINQFPKELSQNKKSGHETHFSRRCRERQRTQPRRPAIDGQHRASSEIILGTDTSISSDALTRNHAVLPTSRTVSSRPKSFAKRLSTARTPLPAERGGDISFDHPHCQAARCSRPATMDADAMRDWSRGSPLVLAVEILFKQRAVAFHARCSCRQLAQQLARIGVLLGPMPDSEDDRR